jgi:iron complex outermembrane receptor protein
MKYLITFLMIFFIVSTSFGQAKKRDKVKRKYRDVEKTSDKLEIVWLRGEIYDWDKTPLPGANVTIDGFNKGVHTNQDGEFLIKNLNTGKIRIRVSYVGFQTKTTDLVLRPGENYKKIMLRTAKIHLPTINVSPQKRDQHILDVPEAITSVSSNTIEQSNITRLDHLSEFVPGLLIREQGANRPGFVIRGLTSDEVSPSAQPRISVYMNNIPINRASSASVELFDMERVEVLKGPQNALFGRGAQAGAIHFISKKPINSFYGNVSAGLGNFFQREVQGVVNTPLIEDKLFIRAAGIYRAHDGYVKNTFGGTLNGKNTVAGRLSARFHPDYYHNLELVLNYQKDDTPGIAFMSKMLPNTNGDTAVFGGIASLEQGNNLGTGKDIFDATINYKMYASEHTYFTTVTSFRKSSSWSRWDGDGTAAAAIDMAEDADAKQFYQEFRLNFAMKSRFNGSVGGSYWWEKANQTYWFSPNEQDMFHLFNNPAYLVTPDGQPNPVTVIPANPDYGIPYNLPLPDHHEEEKFNSATNRAVEMFLDGTFQVSQKVFVTGGIRGMFDMFKLSDEAAFTGGSESTLGMFTGNLPNLFFKPTTQQEISKKTLSFTGRIGIQYKFNEYGNTFLNYSRGRRPNVLQFTSTGEPEILDAEILDNYEVGFKGTIFERVYFDIIGFLQEYSNFQTRAWVANPETGEFNYKVKDGGKATAYGFETTVKAAIIEQLDLFGNYAYLHTAFDSLDVDENIQEYSGNRFRLAPEHSFTVGFDGHIYVVPEVKLFVSPSYSYKTHIYFEDANTPGLEQEAYGLLNINGGIEMERYNLTLSAYGTNLLEEQYVTSAGNTGNLFGVPTFVPGSPRMYGVKMMWKFPSDKKKRRRVPLPPFEGVN